MAMIPVVKVCKDRHSFLQTDDTFASCAQLNMQLMVEFASPLRWDFAAPWQLRNATTHHTSVPYLHTQISFHLYFTLCLSEEMHYFHSASPSWLSIKKTLVKHSYSVTCTYSEWLCQGKGNDVLVTMLWACQSELNVMKEWFGAIK